jgi:valyl-tRNA synthetase
VEGPGERPKGFVVSVTGDVEVLVGLLGHVEPTKEAERIERTLKKIDKDLTGLVKRLTDPKFVANAPPEVVEQAKGQKGALERQRERLEQERGLIDELSPGETR